MINDQNEKVQEEQEPEVPEEEVELDYDTSESDSKPIWPVGRRKRRRLRYLNFSKVAGIFPEASAAVVCRLSEMVEIAPSKVMEVVPDASTAQIGDFLQLAEKSIEKEKEECKSPWKADIEGDPKAQDKISLLGQVPAPKDTPALSCPTDVKSSFMEELKKLVPPKDGGNKVTSVQFSEQFQEKILTLLEASSAPARFDAEHLEKVYQKLKKDPLARSRLESLHAARAHKYGHAHFGPKYLYKESANVAKKLKSQAERRKFRAGLKGLVDFVNQLNIMDLEKLLKGGESEGFKVLKMPGPIKPETMCGLLKNVPPLKLIKFINKQKASDTQKLLERISSLAHFSQSMTDFFAHDDALEPVLAVVCEFLRNNAESGEALPKNSTFLSLAQPYDKQRSEADHDVGGGKRPKRFSEFNRSGRRSSACCYAFQVGRCRSKGCTFKHECEGCGSRSHGELACENKRKRKRRARKSKN